MKTLRLVIFLWPHFLDLLEFLMTCYVIALLILYGLFIVAKSTLILGLWRGL